MRTAADFNSFYATPDPWGIEHAPFRDRVYRRHLGTLTAGKTVLELGCGEGHLTHAVFGNAKTVTGVDISTMAIERAKAKSLPNARFETMDFLQTSFVGYEIIAALECLCYLSPIERELFFGKLADEHSGKIFVFSNPIIGGAYFTHRSLLETFSRFGMVPIEWHNLNIYWKAGLGRTIASIGSRLSSLLPYWPERFIYQRLYKIRMM